MKMFDELEQLINSRINSLESVLKEINSLKMINIQGSLRISSSRIFPKYYHLKSKGDRNGEYISTENMPLIKALAQKSYNEQMLKLTSDELRTLYKIKQMYPEKTFDNYLDSLPQARQALIDPVWLTDDEYVRQWLCQDYRQKEFRPDDTSEFITNTGLRVRSKTEVNIANNLDKYGFPFLYELPLYLENFGWVYPDFTVLMVRTRTIKIWEHHGMLDEESYRENSFMRKNRAYMSNGFFTGRNLIQTFESRKTPLSIPAIESIIEEYLM